MNESDIKAIQVATTTSEKADAERIAQSLLQQRLAACVQISGPLQSSYWWNGQIEQATEWLCTIKTLDSAYSRVEQAIRDAHPYDEPEIIATPIVGASAGYLAWLEQEVRHA